MNNELCCVLTEQELFSINGGGGFFQGLGCFVGGMAVAWSPVVCVVCPPAGIGMFLGGLGIIGKATGGY